MKTRNLASTVEATVHPQEGAPIDSKTPEDLDWPPQCESTVNGDHQIYLDQAATSFPKPHDVREAISDYISTCGGSPGRGSHRKARQAQEMVHETRCTLAHFFGVRDPSRLVFTSNSTEALNLAIHGVLRPGDEILITDLEHNAVARPVWKFRESLGIDLAIVESGPDGIVDPASIAAKIGPRTRLVCCPHVNNVLGTIQPIAEIGRLTRERGVLFLVDASQSAGVLPIDVVAMNIDLLAFTGHKSLLGPAGTGGLYVREGVVLEPLKLGGTGIASESLEPPSLMPEAYEAGTPNAPGLAGLLAGVRFVRMLDLDRILEHERMINARFVDKIHRIPGLRLYGPSDPATKVGITLFSLETLDPTDVASLLDRRYSVMVRSGLHCSALTHRKLGTEHRGAVRVSCGWMTSPSEIDAAAAALAEIAAASTF
jgi:cysteine desulfurase family protein